MNSHCLSIVPVDGLPSILLLFMLSSCDDSDDFFELVVTSDALRLWRKGVYLRLMMFVEAVAVADDDVVVMLVVAGVMLVVP